MASIIETVTLEMINETSTGIPSTEITTQSHGIHNLMVCKLVFKHQHGYLLLRLQHNLMVCKLLFKK